MARQRTFHLHVVICLRREYVHNKLLLQRVKCTCNLSSESWGSAGKERRNRARQRLPTRAYLGVPCREIKRKTLGNAVPRGRENRVEDPDVSPSFWEPLWIAINLLHSEATLLSNCTRASFRLICATRRLHLIRQSRPSGGPIDTVDCPVWYLTHNNWRLWLAQSKAILKSAELRTFCFYLMYIHI
jgi:hypothetical protein